MNTQGHIVKRVSLIVSKCLLLFLTLILSGVPSFAKAQSNEVKLWAYADWIDSIWPIVQPVLQERYPEIKVTLAPNDSLEMGTIRPALISGQGPDLLQVDAGPGRMGILASAGLLTPMEPFYEKYGWDVLPWTEDRVRHPGPNGANNLFGVPNQVEFIAVFYKKQVFDDLGLTEPQTYEEFITLLTKLRDSGYLPLIEGFRDTYPRGHYISTFFQASAGKEEVDNILKGSGSWEEEDFVLGAREAQRMANEKFLIPESQSINGGDAFQLFLTNPQVVMTITGTWSLPDLVASEESFDFFALPAINPDLSPGLIGGIGVSFAIPESASDPEAAARVLDVLYSEEVQRQIVEQVGYISPFTYNKATWELPDLTKSVVDILFDPGVTVGYNLSQVTPAGFVDEYYAAVQELTIGSLTPEAFVARLEAAWQTHRPKQP